jgi:hypothetical protein
MQASDFGPEIVRFLFKREPVVIILAFRKGSSTGRVSSPDFTKALGNLPVVTPKFCQYKTGKRGGHARSA